MKAGARVALGVAAGYLLGRTKKMRLALMIAAAGATGRTGASPAKLLQGGLKQLGSSPELGKLTDMARDELLGAAKAAAVTAVSSRIESLSERLQEGGRGRHHDSDDELEDKHRADDDEEPESDENGTTADDEAADTAEESERPTRRRTASRRSSSSTAEKQPARRTRASSGRSPVRRTGR